MSTTLSDLWLRIRAGILLSLVGFFLSLSSLVNKQPRPSFVKAYPVRRGLKHEFFLPKVYDKGKKYPLLIDIHGGGFAAGTPATDRILNQYFCDHVGVIVVSVNYRKAPKYQFPIGCKDVAAVIKSILEDKELNVDLEKVCIIGYSAGGNLALGAALQLPSSTFQSVLPIYPVVDWTLKRDEKMKSRPPGPDGLYAVGEDIRRLYIPVDQDVSDPLLSPTFADPAKLPQKLYIIGAEYDLLVGEAETFAKKMTAAGKDVEWTKVLGARHGFTHRAKTEEAKKMQDAFLEQTTAYLRRVYGIDSKA